LNRLPIRLAFLLFLLPRAVLAQAKPAAPAPDTLVFVNGEQLTGDLEKADAGGITFKSPMAGEITVKWANIKELRSNKSFAVLSKNVKLTRKGAMAEVPQGTVAVAEQKITAGTKTVPVAETSLLVPQADFNKAVTAHETPLNGWGGAASAGVSVVRATEDTTTFNGAIALTKSSPTVGWLPLRNRTLISYNQSYGNTTQAGTTPIETNIFHASGERDEYFSPRLFGFGSATFDHNFSQNLGLQSAYGGGIGMTVVKNAKQQLDIKADVHFLKETFFVNTLNPTPSPNVNVVASTFSETYLRKLPKGLVLNEFGSVSPSWTNETDLSSHINGSLVFPVFKGLGFNVTAADDFLNNAPVGTHANSTQFTMGLSYAIKPR
jgi:hypothetical protein